MTPLRLERPDPLFGHVAACDTIGTRLVANNPHTASR